MAGASIGTPECGTANPARRNRSPLRLPAYLPEDALDRAGMRMLYLRAGPRAGLMHRSREKFLRSPQ